MKNCFYNLRLISDEEQAKYEEACRKFPVRAKKVLNIRRNGSNIFKILLLNQVGIRTANLEELELALENDFDLQGSYADCPVVVLRSAGDSYKEGDIYPNDYIAKLLAKDLEVREFKAPLVVNGLELVVNNDSYYGLSFKRTDKTEIVEALDLKFQNNQRRFTRIKSDYSIDFDDKVERMFLARENGISRLYFYSDLALISGDGCLSCSHEIGKILVMDSV